MLLYVYGGLSGGWMPRRFVGECCVVSVCMCVCVVLRVSLRENASGYAYGVYVLHAC